MNEEYFGTNLKGTITEDEWARIRKTFDNGKKVTASINGWEYKSYPNELELAREIMPLVDKEWSNTVTEGLRITRKTGPMGTIMLYMQWIVDEIVCRESNHIKIGGVSLRFKKEKGDSSEGTQ